LSSRQKDAEEFSCFYDFWVYAKIIPTTFTEEPFFLAPEGRYIGSSNTGPPPSFELRRSGMFHKRILDMPLLRSLKVATDISPLWGSERKFHIVQFYKANDKILLYPNKIKIFEAIEFNWN
jgi:hypothetical protein